MTDVSYACCRHCTTCGFPGPGHPVPCTKCPQTLRVTADQLVARDMNSGGGVNADHCVFPAKDAPKDGSGPSGVPAPPPDISWSSRRATALRRWWNPRALTNASTS
jgi:hypothetical protein